MKEGKEMLIPGYAYFKLCLKVLGKWCRGVGWGWVGEIS